MFFKDEEHKEDTYRIIKNLGREFGKDSYYDSFSYLAALSGKADFIIEHSDSDGIKTKKIKEGMDVFSSSEKGILRLALQLFNSSLDEISIDEVIAPLSKSNARGVITAIEIRYKI